MVKCGCVCISIDSLLDVQCNMMFAIKNVCFKNGKNGKQNKTQDGRYRQFMIQTSELNI